MKTYRIGVLSDTHVPELMPVLPTAVVEALEGTDLIIHLGDITGEALLRDLSRLAPVVALSGDHDRLPLPRQMLLHVQGKRLALVHGKSALYRGLAAIAAGQAEPRSEPWWSGLLGTELESVNELDAILFGYAHRPYMARHQGVLLFSPGGVYQRTAQMLRDELARNPALPRRLALQRQLDQAEKSGDDAVMPPTVGLLTIERGALSAEVRPVTVTP